MYKSIGEKVRKFRELNQMTQYDLELAIGTSYGKISKIENDKINPTKETLQKISDALHLNYYTRASLFGLEITGLDQKEISEAIGDLKDNVDNHLGPAYLIDYMRNIYYWNEFSSKLYEFPENQSSINLLEFYFNPKYKVVEKLGELQFIEHAEKILLLVYQEVGYLEDSLLTLFEKMKGYPYFPKIYQKVKPTWSDRIPDSETHNLEVDTQFGKLKFQSSCNRYFKNQKLILVKYFAQDTQTLEIISKMVK